MGFEDKDYEPGSFGSHLVIPARHARIRVPWMAKTMGDEQLGWFNSMASARNRAVPEGR